MAAKKIIKPAKSPAAVGPYNHAVRVGDLLFCAGQIPIDPATGNLVAGDIKAQTERVLQNVKAILDDQHLTFESVVKSTVFLTNLGDFAGMNEVYARYFTGDFPGGVQTGALGVGMIGDSCGFEGRGRCIGDARASFAEAGLTMFRRERSNAVASLEPCPPLSV